MTGPVPDAVPPDDDANCPARGEQWWTWIAVTVLPLVAAVGAVLSWGSLYEAAARTLGAQAPTLHGVNLAGAAFPLLVDALILGASARYVAGVKAARPVGGWRIAAHAGVAGTVLLNAAASPTVADIPWHVTAPIVWSVLVELVARDVLGELRDVHPTTGSTRIPVRLWLTTPAESVRVSWRMARTSEPDADTVRAVTERCAAARDQLTAAHPGRAHRRVRRQITRRLWAGALDPATLAHLIETQPDPAALHRAVLRTVAAAAPAGSTHGESTPDPSPVVPSVRPVPVPPVPIPGTGPSAPSPVAGPAAVAACESGPARSAAVAAVPVPASTDDARTPTEREATDLERITTAVQHGQIHGPVTKAKIREHLRCSNPHAGTINTLYQQQNTS